MVRFIVNFSWRDDRGFWTIFSTHKRSIIVVNALLLTCLLLVFKEAMPSTRSDSESGDSAAYNQYVPPAWIRHFQNQCFQTQEKEYPLEEKVAALFDDFAAVADAGVILYDDYILFYEPDYLMNALYKAIAIQATEFVRAHPALFASRLSELRQRWRSGVFPNQTNIRKSLSGPLPLDGMALLLPDSSALSMTHMNSVQIDLMITGFTSVHNAFLDFLDVQNTTPLRGLTDNLASSAKTMLRSQEHWGYETYWALYNGSDIVEAKAQQKPVKIDDDIMVWLDPPYRPRRDAPHAWDTWVLQTVLRIFFSKEEFDSSLGNLSSFVFQGGHKPELDQFAAAADRAAKILATAEAAMQQFEKAVALWIQGHNFVQVAKAGLICYREDEWRPWRTLSLLKSEQQQEKGEISEEASLNLLDQLHHNSEDITRTLTLVTELKAQIKAVTDRWEALGQEVAGLVRGNLYTVQEEVIHKPSDGTCGRRSWVSGTLLVTRTIYSLRSIEYFWTVSHRVQEHWGECEANKYTKDIRDGGLISTKGKSKIR